MPTADDLPGVGMVARERGLSSEHEAPRALQVGAGQVVAVAVHEARPAGGLGSDAVQPFQQAAAEVVEDEDPPPPPGAVERRRRQAQDGLPRLLDAAVLEVQVEWRDVDLVPLEVFRQAEVVAIRFRLQPRLVHGSGMSAFVVHPQGFDAVLADQPQLVEDADDPAEAEVLLLDLRSRGRVVQEVTEDLLIREVEQHRRDRLQLALDDPRLELHDVATTLPGEMAVADAVAREHDHRSRHQEHEHRQEDEGETPPDLVRPVGDLPALRVSSDRHLFGRDDSLRRRGDAVASACPGGVGIRLQELGPPVDSPLGASADSLTQVAESRAGARCGSAARRTRTARSSVIKSNRYGSLGFGITSRCRTGTTNGSRR